MTDDHTPRPDTTPLGRSVEEIEQDSGNAQTQPSDDARTVPVPPVAAPMGGGVSGVPAVGGSVLPIVPGGEDVTRRDDEEAEPS